MVQDQDHQSASAIHPKRTLAFVNHFIIKNVQFINNFASSCDEKLIDFEFKMQKLEASLAILEAKLASIPGFDEPVTVQKEEVKEIEEKHVTEENEPHITKETSEETPEKDTNAYNPREDPQYAKYFKMIQVGVPLQAVKMKVVQEGLDPSVLG